MRDPRLTAYAQQMRTNATEPEKRLWRAIRAKRFAGIKFRRQKVIGPYIVDFACREPMLAIELDGDSHASRENYDRERSEYLKNEGYTVVRFTNSEILSNLDGVLNAISTHIPPLPTLSPKGERS